MPSPRTQISGVAADRAARPADGAAAARAQRSTGYQASSAYLRDDDEYRAIARETSIRGLAGTITWTPAAITVSLQPPAAPRVRQALALLIDQINQDPLAMPGDHRPITYLADGRG